MVFTILKVVCIVWPKWRKEMGGKITKRILIEKKKIKALVNDPGAMMLLTNAVSQGYEQSKRKNIQYIPHHLY